MPPSKIFYIFQNYCRFSLKYLKKLYFVQKENWYVINIILSDITYNIIEMMICTKNDEPFFP